VAVNKWDGQSDYQREQTRALLDRKLSFCTWAEQVTISASTAPACANCSRQSIARIASATRKFTTAEVTKALEVAVETFRRQWFAAIRPSFDSRILAATIRRCSWCTARD
jgi:GTP-binding protein